MPAEFGVVELCGQWDRNQPGRR